MDATKIKEFFKPNWMKLIVLIGLIAISLSFGISKIDIYHNADINSPNQAVWMSAPIYHLLHFPFFPITFNLTSSFTGGLCGYYFNGFGYMGCLPIFLIVLLSLIYWYVLSCIFAFLFEKARTKFQTK